MDTRGSQHPWQMTVFASLTYTLGRTLSGPFLRCLAQRPLRIIARLQLASNLFPTFAIFP